MYQFPASITARTRLVPTPTSFREQPSHTRDGSAAVSAAVHLAAFMKRGHAAIRTSSPSGATADFFPGDIGRRQSPRTSTSAYASARNRDGSGVLGDLLTPTLSFLSGSLAAGAKLTAAAGAGAEGDGGGRVAGRSACVQSSPRVACRAYMYFLMWWWVGGGVGAASAAARRARGSYFDLDFVEAGTAKEVISPRLLKCACEAPSLGHAKCEAYVGARRV